MSGRLAPRLGVIGALGVFGPLVFALSLGAASSVAHAAEPEPEPEPELELESPQPRARLRGQSSLEVVVAQEPGAHRARESMTVEVDGRAVASIPAWSRRTRVEVEPGLHGIQVVARSGDGATTRRSAVAQVAVFEGSAASQPLDPPTRNAWLTLVAFVVAVGGALSLQRRASW